MAGLVLSLKPNEKFLVNGALLSNGPKRGQICVGDDDVNVLRMSDVIHPSEVNTPVRRVYYAAQIILSGDVGAIETDADIRKGLEALATVFADTPLIKNINKAQAAAANARYYSVLCALKPLLRIEEDLLAQPVPKFSSDEMLPAMAS
ncbi:flagellar biosynthesis repressor FlbT [Hellea sp.]|nr:flagellar biosynthesis repressor FlbT [Hellea sp.]